MWHYTKKERRNFLTLVKSKYFLSLAQPGEPVGVLAAQSIGEPSTQMTLNTFHHAGRGEMNVTLGIPRLQEIIMTASSTIRTPTMTCPLRKGKSRDDAKQLAAKMRKVSVADLIENMEVCIVPFTISKHDAHTLYKLQMKLYGPESYPPHADISLEDCKETLEIVFTRQLEDAIEKHMQLLSKISGITDFTSDSNTSASNNIDDDGDDDEGNKLQRSDAGSDDEAANEGGDDLGLDVKKRKQQATDEMDYEDASDSEVQGEMPTDENDSEGDESEQEVDDDISKQDDSLASLTKGLDDETPLNSKSTPEKVKPTSKKKKSRSVKSEKDSDRAIYVACDGQHFEAHFKFPMNEPHIMLTQIVQKTARKVAIKNPGSVDQCKVVDILLDESGSSSKSGGIPMLKQGKESRIALQTAGVDFMAFWDMEDDLDVNYISSNNVDAILRTYGIEAARATIITEIWRVFKYFGAEMDIRHLMLLADFMTHTGEYRPMSRTGGIAESTSAFARMCFETASKFIVEAATHNEKDDLETPSARVCLGLPAKVGTGCFDLLHELDL